MNYFEFYGLPISFAPDQKAVKSQFYALSKKYHPDFYISESQEKQDEVLQLSTLNNKAYQVLSNPKKLLPYVLELKGEMKEGENYQLPQDFLMEMMDVNEAVMELQFDLDGAKKQEVTQQLATIQHDLHQQMQSSQQMFDDGDDTVLKTIKDLYYRNKYLLRIQEALDKL